MRGNWYEVLESQENSKFTLACGITWLMCVQWFDNKMWRIRYLICIIIKIKHCILVKILRYMFLRVQMLYQMYNMINGSRYKYKICHNYLLWCVWYRRPRIRYCYLVAIWRITKEQIKHYWLKYRALQENPWNLNNCCRLKDFGTTNQFTMGIRYMPCRMCLIWMGTVVWRIRGGLWCTMVIVGVRNEWFA